MDIQRSELLRGVSSDFVKQIRAITVKESYDTGDILFRKGDPAEYLYVLLMGRIKLSLGERKQVVHIVSRSGEAFGWSSLVGRKSYAGWAECETPATLQKIDSHKLLKILEKDPVSASAFYRQLAAMLGSRLLQSYSRYEKVFTGKTLI